MVFFLSFFALFIQHAIRLQYDISDLDIVCAGETQSLTSHGAIAHPQGETERQSERSLVLLLTGYSSFGAHQEHGRRTS